MGIFSGLCGVVCDAKLFVIRSNAVHPAYVYDPEFDKWTVELNVPSEFWYFPVQDAGRSHKGRVVVFLQSGTTCSVRLAPGALVLSLTAAKTPTSVVHDNHNGNADVRGRVRSSSARHSTNKITVPHSLDPQPQLGRQLALVLEPVAERVDPLLLPPFRLFFGLLRDTRCNQ